MSKELITLPLAEIHPYAKNPRINDDAVDDVKESIIQCGYIAPIIIDENNEILAGHTRWKALKELKTPNAQVIRIKGMTEEQKKKYRLLDNKVAEKAEWDFELLSWELDGLDFDGYDFGFDFSLPEDEPEIIEDDIPEEAESRCHEGDIWKLGRHRLMCGDSTDIETVQALCGDRAIDLLVTDPPYNVAYEGKTKDALTIDNDRQDDDSFRDFLTDAFVAANAVMRAGAAFYIWHADSEGFNFRYAVKAAGWQCRQCLIWNKNTMVMGRQDYQWKHESCLYGWKEGAAHMWASDRKQTTVLDFDRPTRSAEHPTMKPVALFDYQIKNSSNKGDAVLDLFAGSGTTVMACEQNGRAAYVMELSPHYCDVIIKRWEDFTGETAVLLNGSNSDGE